MARTTPQPPRDPGPPKLTRSRTEATERIGQQLAAGRDLAQNKVTQWTELEVRWNELSKWKDFTEHLLRTLFTTDAVAKEFRAAGFPSQTANSEAEMHAHLIDVFVARQLPKLESIYERLPLFDEPRGTAEIPTVERVVPTADKSKVFIVHGHDGAALHETARFVEQLGLRPIILSEQPNEGATIIEKLTANSDVGFAIVLLTADDVGAARGARENLQDRARQNVILELGYFVGKLGRKNVCPMYEAGVELPSDYHGVGYIPLGKGGAWKLLLAKEMKAAGLGVDMNKAV